MIKNIVFDMGQVIIRFEPETFLNRYDISEGDKKLINKELFRSVEWVMTDHGVMNASEAADSVNKRLPEYLHRIVRELSTGWFDPVLYVDGTEDFIKELKSNGYNIWLLSNAGINQPEYWSKLPVAEYFSGTLISSEVGMMKPDPDIYRSFTERFGLKPEECLFIDDNPMNVEMSIRCGWKGIVFYGDISELRRKAAEQGIRCLFD